MERPNKILEQIAFITRPITEEHMLVVMDEIFLEENLSQPLRTSNKNFKKAVTILTGYNGTLMFQIQLIGFISQIQTTMMILVLFQFQPAHMNSRV